MRVQDVLVHRARGLVTPTSVYAHEVPLLDKLYGADSIVKQSAHKVPGTIDVSAEFLRLRRVYPTVINQVYGSEDALRKAIKPAGK